MEKFGINRAYKGMFIALAATPFVACGPSVSENVDSFAKHYHIAYDTHTRQELEGDERKVIGTILSRIETLKGPGETEAIREQIEIAAYKHARISPKAKSALVEVLTRKELSLKAS